MTQKEIKDKVRNTVAALELEGLYISDEVIRIYKEYLRGNITKEEAKNQIIRSE